MPMTNEQLKAISDSDFGLILEEFRSRGYAVAAYGVAELGEGPLQDVHGNYDAAVNAPQGVLRHSADL